MNRVIRELSTKPKTLTITNGVDMDYFAPTSTLLEADKFVFTGVMDYAPNEDAALHFVEDIFPLVKAKRPEVQFWIVGSEPSERVRALTRISGVHVTGNVDDVRPYVTECDGLCVSIARRFRRKKQDSGCHGHAESDRRNLDEYRRAGSGRQS